MENNELMEYVKEIKNYEHKRVFWSRISCILLGLLVISFISLLPTLFKTLNNANSAMNTATEALDMATDTLDQAQDIMDDLTDTVDNMDVAITSITKLVDDSSVGLQTAFENINSIDFKGLNDAITDLGNVVEPLSKFFGKFKY